MIINETSVELWNPVVESAIKGNEHIWKRAGNISSIKGAIVNFIHYCLMVHGKEAFNSGKKEYQRSLLLADGSPDLTLSNMISAMKVPINRFVNQSQVWKLVPQTSDWASTVSTLMNTETFKRVLDRAIQKNFGNTNDIIRESRKNDTFQDMKLVVEVPAGGVRKGTGPSGDWERTVKSSYGYIKNTKSPDGEELDFWMKSKPNPNSKIYVVHQMTFDGKKFDEDKVMLGYSTSSEAERAYKSEMPNPEKQFGGITEFDSDHFMVIAYQSRKNSGILTTEDNFKKFKAKGLLKNGIKSPVQISKIIKENGDLVLSNKLKVIYAGNEIEESRGIRMEPIIMIVDPDVASTVARLIKGWSINATINGDTVEFETSDDVDRYLSLIDDNGLDTKLQGDLAGNSPIKEDTNLDNPDLVSKISKELANSLKRSTGGVWTDHFYSLIGKYLDMNALTDDALSNFMNNVIRQFKLENNGMEPYELDAMNANDHPDEYFTKGVRFTESEIDDNFVRKIAFELATNLGNYIPDGEWTDCLDVILRKYDLGTSAFPKYPNLLENILVWFSKDNGGQEPNDVMADMWDAYTGAEAESGEENPYRITETSMEDTGMTVEPETGEYAVIVHLQPFRNGRSAEYPFWLPENAREEVLKTDLTESQAKEFVETFLESGSYLESDTPGKKTQVLGIQIIDKITYLNKFGESFKLTESKKAVNEIDVLAGITDKKKNVSNYPSFTDMKKLFE